MKMIPLISKANFVFACITLTASIGVVSCKTRKFGAGSVNSAGSENGLHTDVSTYLTNASSGKNVVIFGEPLDAPEVTDEMISYIWALELSQPGRLKSVGLETFTIYQKPIDGFLANGDAALLLATRDREALRGWLDKAPLFGARQPIMSDRILALLQLIRKLNEARTESEKIKVVAFDSRPQTSLDFRHFTLVLNRSLPWAFGRDETLRANLGDAVREAVDKNGVHVMLTGSAHAQKSGAMTLSGPAVFLLPENVRKPKWLATRLVDEGVKVLSIEFGSGKNKCDRIAQQLVGRGKKTKVVVDLASSPLGETRDFRCKSLIPGIKATFVPAEYPAKEQFDAYVFLPAAGPSKPIADDDVKVTGGIDLSDAFASSMTQPDTVKKTMESFSGRGKPPQIVFVPGLSAFQFRKAIELTVWKTPGGKEKVHDYFADQMEACARLNLNCKLVPLDTSVPIEKNATALAEEFRALEKGAFIIAHSRGGIDSLRAFTKLSDEELKGIGAFAAINTPFGGIYPADIIAARSPEPVKKIFSPFFNVNDELSSKSQGAFVDANESALARVKVGIPAMFTVGSWISDDNKENSMLFPLAKIVQKTLPKSGFSGLNDGVVAIEDTRLRDVPFAVVPQHDHVSSVFNIANGPQMNREAFLVALLAQMQSLK